MKAVYLKKVRLMARERPKRYVDGDISPFMWNYANKLVLFDNVFQTIIGPSSPNAIAMIAGQSGSTQWVKHPNTDASTSPRMPPFLDRCFGRRRPGSALGLSQRSTEPAAGFSGRTTGPEVGSKLYHQPNLSRAISIPALLSAWVYATSNIGAKPP